MLDRMERRLAPRVRVLYVEDNAANVELMQRIFMGRPLLELVVATDGASARDLARTATPKLVFVDVNLPDMSGENLIAHLQTDLGEATPPLVVLSADAMSGTIDRFRALGIAEYMTKPYDIQHLLDVLDVLLDMPCGVHSHDNSEHRRNPDPANI
jgi:CheY-like chemotaxis protein